MRIEEECVIVYDMYTCHFGSSVILSRHIESNLAEFHIFLGCSCLNERHVTNVRSFDVLGFINSTEIFGIQTNNSFFLFQL
jgi:hypothetical protein